MSDHASTVFDAQATTYDAARRRLIPPFDAFYGTAVRALELCPSPPRRILDLGAGTGMLSAFVRAAHPGAELVLLDAAPAMLEQARTAVTAPLSVHVADLAGPLPAGPFDAVVSALAIHHLEDAGKRALLARVLVALSPGGVFVDAEQVAAPTPAMERRYRAWHREASAALGTSAEEWAAAEARMAYDRCADVGSQLAWLRDAGFADADCVFKDHCFAVLTARRPAPP